MIHLLPRWNLHQNRPTFYDTDSVTMLELASNLHGKMNELIEDYNTYVDSVNKTITDFLNSEQKDEETFRTALRQEFQDFIDAIDLKTMHQDQEIEDGVRHMKNNLTSTIEKTIENMVQTGEFEQVVLNALEDIRDDVNALTTSVDDKLAEVDTKLAEVDNDLAEKETAFNDKVALLEAKILTAASDATGAVDNLALELSANVRSHVYPRLDPDHFMQLRTLANAYYSKRSNIIYDFNTIRTAYESHTTAFNEAGKLRMNCGLFAMLVWAGVDPNTFFDTGSPFNQPDTDGSLTKFFDWGYEFRFTSRKIYGLVKSTTEEDPDKKYYYYVDSVNSPYSANTYYDAETDSQKFYGFAGVAEMARELHMMGCEVPLSEMQIGDIIFFADRARVHENPYDKMRFRGIDHCAIITDLYDDSKFAGGPPGTKIEPTRTHTLMRGLYCISPMLTECTPRIGSANQLSQNRIDTSSLGVRVRHVDLMNHVEMVCRHPFAFGYASNMLGDKFSPLEKPDGSIG